MGTLTQDDDQMTWKTSKLSALHEKLTQLAKEPSVTFHFRPSKSLTVCPPGILTKPDTLGPGARNQRKMWKDLIEGRSENHQLKHGYYCVRLPDDEERARKISRLDSQLLAAEFFDTTEPWNSVTDRRRFGIPNFVADVGGLLVKLIQN